MKSRGIIVLIGIAVVIIAVIVINNPSETLPKITDNVNVIDSSNFEVTKSTQDKLNISESSNVTITSGITIETDEEGNRIITIRSIDKPKIGG